MTVGFKKSRSELLDPRHPFAGGVLFFLASLIAFTVAFQFRTPLRLDVGTGDDAAFTPSGFFRQERDAGQSFRWTTGDGKILIPFLGKTMPTRLSLRLNAAAPNGARAVELFVNDRFLARIENEGWKTYRYVIQDLTMLRSELLTVELRSATFAPIEYDPSSGDSRTLGVAVDWILVEPIFDPATPLTVPPSNVLILSAIFALSYVGGLQAGIRRRWIGLGLGAAESVILGIVAFDRIHFLRTADALLFGLFAGLIAVALYRRLIGELHLTRRELGVGLVLLFAIGLVSLTLVELPGTADVRIQLGWLTNIDTRGLVPGYIANQSNYPPLDALILFLIAREAHTFAVEPFTAFKLSLLLCLLLSFVVAWSWTGSYWKSFAFAAVLILYTMVFGYVDIYIVPTFLLAMWAIKEGKFARAVALITITCLIKWQPIVLLPALSVYMLNITLTRVEAKRADNTPGARARSAGRAKWLQTARLAMPALLIVSVTGLVFGSEPLISLRRALNDPFLSGYALNLNWVVTHLLRALYPQLYGGLDGGYADAVVTSDWRPLLFAKLVFGALYVITLISFWKSDRSFEKFILFSLLAYLGYFTFNSGVHENHLFIAVLLSAILFWSHTKHWITFAIVSVAANLNLLLFYNLQGKELERARVFAGVDLALPFAILYVLLFLVSFIVVIRKRGARSAGATLASREYA